MTSRQVIMSPVGALEYFCAHSVGVWGAHGGKNVENHWFNRTLPMNADSVAVTLGLSPCLYSQLIKECNSSVQSMKRMEELIHLNKKIHFEGKVHYASSFMLCITVCLTGLWI